MFTIESVINLKWCDEEKTVIECLVKYAEFDEPHPTGVNAHCPDKHIKEIWTKALTGEYGVIAEYVPPPPPPPPTTEQLAAQARAERDQLLGATDWTQAADVPQATKDKWAPYRQALRDVPQQSGFPTDIVWPTKPA